MKAAFKDQGFRGKQTNEEKLRKERADGGRELKSSKEVYDETKVWVAFYMGIWISLDR